MHPSTAFAATAPRRHARRRRYRPPVVQRIPSRHSAALVALLTSALCAVLVGSVSAAAGGA